MSLPGVKATAGMVTADSFYKVPFEQVPDLVASRRVYLQVGGRVGGRGAAVGGVSAVAWRWWQWGRGRVALPHGAAAQACPWLRQARIGTSPSAPLGPALPLAPAQPCSLAVLCFLCARGAHSCRRRASWRSCCAGGLCLCVPGPDELTGDTAL